MTRVAFRTLGCRLNQAETDQMAADLAAAGFEVAGEPDGADVIVVNSCTVTVEASRSSRKAAEKAARSNPGAMVALAGCYVEAEREAAEAVPGVGLVVTNQEKERIAAILGARLGPNLPLMKTGPAAPPAPMQVPAFRARANLKVQTGCDEHCSFCIIPATRGPLRSEDLPEVVAAARRKVAQGARELVLTGVHLGKYGWDAGRPGEALCEMLEKLLAIDALARIRLSSILCRHLTPSVVSLIASEPRLCRFLHVPLQSGDDAVLKAMNRPYTRAEYLEAIGRVRAGVGEAGLATDVIVGFPGETPAQFDATMEVVEQAGFMKLHVFRYSPRPGTPSAAWSQVPEAEKKQRSRELIALGRDLSAAFLSSQTGRSREVLVEETPSPGELCGHTDNFVMARFQGPPRLVGNLARVRVQSASGEGVLAALEGEVPWHEADPRDQRCAAPACFQ